MTELDEDTVYEQCPMCDGEDIDCAWCDSLGLVPHDCDEVAA